MEKEQLDDGTNLYFEHYQVIQYVANELRPAAETEIKRKLKGVLDQLEGELDGHDGLSVVAEEESLSLWVYPSEDWSDEDVDADVAVFLKLKWDFKDTNAMSSLGITCQAAPEALAAVQGSHDEGQEWLEELSRAHGTKQSDQFYRELDWYEEFDTFDDMASELVSELRELAAGLKTLLAEAEITP